MDNKEVGDKSKALSHGNINYGATLSQDLSSDQLSLDQFEIRREKKEDHIIATDYDTALLECGYGRWHWMLAMSCGLANAADAVEILCTSFLLPSAECDLQLTNLRKGTIPIVGFVGMLIGGFLWGTLGDIYGRRSTLIIAMFVNAVFGAVSAASWDYATFLLLRFLSGLGVGGSIPLVWTYFAEFQPSRRRGGALSLLATFWMVGNVTVAGLAWAIIPHQLASWASWRWFTLACAGPSLLVCLVFLLLPESPKFLLCQGRHDEALEILRTIFRKNTGEAGSEFRVRALRREDTGEDGDNQESRNFVKIIYKVFGFLKELFTGSLWKITLILLVINFSIQFGYYGLWYWFPELFNQLTQFYETNPNVTKTVCQIVSENVPSEESDEESFNCALYIPGDEVFINSFIVSLSALPSNLWTIFCMDKLGRKFFLCFSMILSGGTAFLIYLVQSSLMNLVLSCIFGAVSTMGFNSLDCLGVELFPTHLRSTAMAVTLVAARLGAILGNTVFALFLEVQCAIPILMVASLLVAGGLLGLILPNTTNIPLE